jgi:hypothetical protein
MECYHTGCQLTPHADVQWGGAAKSQTATLCRPHTDELWEQLNPLLQANVCWVRLDEPGKIVAENRERERQAATTNQL